jgi:hypothetical protein
MVRMASRGWKPMVCCQSGSPNGREVGGNDDRKWGPSQQSRGYLCDQRAVGLEEGRVGGKDRDEGAKEGGWGGEGMRGEGIS